MSIKVGENPEGIKGINKFIAKNGEGHRGKIVALSKDKMEAIILSMNTSCNRKDGVVWGHLYLIREDNPEEFPKVIEGVNSIPNTDEWKML